MLSLWTFFKLFRKFRNSLNSATILVIIFQVLLFHYELQSNLNFWKIDNWVDRLQCPPFIPKMQIYHWLSKITQKHMSKFSVTVLFYCISLLYFNCLTHDCGTMFNQDVHVVHFTFMLFFIGFLTFLLVSFLLLMKDPRVIPLIQYSWNHYECAVNKTKSNFFLSETTQFYSM